MVPASGELSVMLTAIVTITILIVTCTEQRPCALNGRARKWKGEKTGAQPRLSFPISSYVVLGLGDA